MIQVTVWWRNEKGEYSNEYFIATPSDNSFSAQPSCVAIKRAVEEFIKESEKGRIVRIEAKRVHDRVLHLSTAHRSDSFRKPRDEP